MTTTTGSRQARKVVAIDQHVRRLIDLYLTLYPNYERAASELRVSKDTLAKYVAGNSNMALYVFRRIAEAVRARYSEDEIRDRLDGVTLRELAARACPSDLRQTDHVMCKIDDRVRLLLDLHSANFRSRSRAAKALAINPRTFKAYFNGQIENFPCKKMVLLLDQLREKGHSDAELLKATGASRWEEVIQTRTRARTLDFGPQELVERIAEYFDSGDLRPQSIDRSLINLSKRLHGGLGATLRLAMEHLVERQTQRVKLHLRDADADAARIEIRRWEHYITTYSHKLSSINRALPREKKWPWRSDILRAVSVKEEYKEELRKLDARILHLDESESDAVATTATAPVRKYDPSHVYKEGERLYHPVFGTGLVTSVEEGERIRVAFKKEYGEVILAINKLPVGPEFSSFEPRMGQRSIAQRTRATQGFRGRIREQPNDDLRDQEG